MRNLDQLENEFKLARVTSGNDDVLNEAYAYENRIHTLEASGYLFLDMLSEASLPARRAFDLFHLLYTRASSSRFFTVVGVASVMAPVSTVDASRAFQQLFHDPDLCCVVDV
jgi:hypothetical protein